jgi:hypothetical protein
MGLAFVLGCLVIAFGIYLGLKGAANTTPANQQLSNNTADNGQVADVAGNQAQSNDDELPAGGMAALEADNNDMDANSASGTPAAPSPSDDMQASSLPHEAFVRDCIMKDGDAFNGIDASDRPALCECLYSRLQSYGRLTAENGKLALNMCKLQWATDRGRFDQDYAPTGVSAQGTDGTDNGQPQ